MEKTTLSQNQTPELLSLDNRKNLHLTGILEVISSSDTQILAKLKDSTLNISGTNINITRLDTADGTLDATGDFNAITYGKKVGFLKRIFK